MYGIYIIGYVCGEASRLNKIKTKNLKEFKEWKHGSFYSGVKIYLRHSKKVMKQKLIYPPKSWPKPNMTITIFFLMSLWVFTRF